MTSIPEGTHESCVLNVLYSIVTSENRGIFRVSQVRILFYLIIVSIQRLLNHLHYSIRHIGPIYRCSFWVYTVGKVLADLLVCDGWRYCKALCEKKFSQIERNRRKFSHMTYAITSLVKFLTVYINCLIVQGKDVSKSDAWKMILLSDLFPKVGNSHTCEVTKYFWMLHSYMCFVQRALWSICT